MIELLRGFVAKVDELGISYMVTGSFAMSSYGEVRTTRDIDIVVQLDAQRVDRFVRAFEAEFYISDASITRALENRSMFNIVNTEWAAKIDCIVQKDTDFARSSFERRREASVGGVKFWTTTKEDLIIAKLDWARDSHSEMQIRDIANLTSSEYDSEYVNAWISRMGLEHIWAEVAQWKTQRQRSEP